MNLPNDNWRDTEAALKDLPGGRDSQGTASAKPDRSPARPCPNVPNGRHRWGYNRSKVIDGIAVNEFKCRHCGATRAE